MEEGVWCDVMWSLILNFFICFKFDLVFIFSSTHHSILFQLDFKFYFFIFQDSGLLNISYFKFDIDDVTGELEANRPVPFRLTPNLTELITNVGVSGPLTASMIAAARCLVHPSFKIQVTIQAVHSTIPQLSFTCSFFHLFLDLFISTSFILLLLHFSFSFLYFFLSFCIPYSLIHLFTYLLIISGIAACSSTWWDDKLAQEEFRS